jgi:U3 small nucleolar RNA-associated protein 10
MFLRLLEWANNPLPGMSAAPIGRVITLFAAASSLSEKLRSVFVPYFKYLLDLAVKHLGGASGAAGSASARKPKKAKKGGEDGESGASEVDTWVLRGRVVRALHRCFLYDTVNFIDQDKVDRLLPPLVAQLSVAPTSAESAVAVAAQCADAELDASVTLGPRTPRDTYGIAVVSALVQLAVTANSDVHWKPLNRQVCVRLGQAPFYPNRGPT